jgi:multisubunit Na+/H+ antiporter MnhB subunit
MKKPLQPAKSIELDVFIISLVFLIVFFFSSQIFEVSFNDPGQRNIACTGMLIIATAAILLTLIVWENLLFSLQIKSVEDGVKVGNHNKKNVFQAFFYLAILVLFLFVFLYYPINRFYYTLWFSFFAAVPILHKLIYSARNRNSFLKLTTSEIQFQNQQKKGRFYLKNIQYIRIVKGAKNSIAKLRLGVDNSEVTIDLDEMKVDAFYDKIAEYIKKNYTTLLKY